MRSKNAPSINVVKREQKQDKIDLFVKQYLSALTADELSPSHKPHSILVLARSPNSPVAKAVAAQNKTIADAGVCVRVIFSQISRDTAWTQADAGFDFAREVALASNPALLDAHEQLVLTKSSSWMGDCLRREPTTSDAYESYADDCELSARSAKLSFERLWKICDPLVSLNATCHKDSEDTDFVPVSDCVAAASQTTCGDGAQKSGPLSGTRH